MNVLRLMYLNGGWQVACGKKISRHPFSPSLLKERALSQVNIGIKYHILLHVFPPTPPLKVIPWFCTTHLLLHITRWPP